ncbi:hypothetical protein [Solicola gregarius]|uniref:Uncharacterized protein n=1 Tax=Solicola gregarius TaxID=2908642 RepID=A0AA46YN30_9ACTN|nr:hypothetical protein [Solicola gregarius]UYM07061.1 hypothetical protein L0C25_08295 [Solicola gregarius]
MSETPQHDRPSRDPSGPAYPPGTAVPGEMAAPNYGPQPYRPPPPRKGPKPRGQAAFRWILVVVLGVHAALAFGQSILAGMYLSGSLDAMEVHGAIGSSLVAVTMLQGVASLLFLFPGGGPWWPLLAAVVLFFVEGLQIGMGYARTLGLHIPLGVAIIVVTIMMFVWSLRWKAKPPKAPTP